MQKELKQKDELDLFTIKKRSVAGALTLTGRTFFIQVVNFFSTFLLTIVLAPDIFGLFFVVSAVINFLVYFSDIGLAAALIQKKGRLNKDDLKTTFTIQEFLVCVLVCLALVLTPSVGKFYNLGSDGLWLFRALVFSFFLSSLKTIPSILLERKLRFNKLVIPQIVETMVFNTTAVFLAFRGYGALSFAWAVLLRGFSGLITIYILSPFKPVLGVVKASAKKLLTFGVPFQANSLLALLKDDFLTVFLGRILPFSEIGFLGWAQKWAFFPLRFFMDSLIRITFPAFSRLQENLAVLKIAVEKALFWVCFLTYPFLVGLAVLAPKLVLLIPKYGKWQPAVLPLLFFAINGLFSCFSTTLTNVLNAIGRIKTTLKLMVFWTTLTWILTAGLVFKIGFVGAALASALVASTSVLVIILVRKVIPFSLKNVLAPFLSAVLMGAVVYLLSQKLVFDFFSLALVVFLGGIIYLSLILLLAKERFLIEIRLLKEHLLKKS